MARHSSYSQTGNVPMGDSFLVQTPEIDQARNYLFQQQQARRAFQQREDYEVEQRMTPEFGKIRGVDNAAVLGLWDQYKNSRKRLLFDPSLQRDPNEYNRVQQESNQHLAQIYQTINDSQQAKELAENLQRAHITHADAFGDDFLKRMTVLQNTPIDQLRGSDLLNPDAYQYQHTLDFNQADKVSKGTQLPRFPKSEKSPDGLQTITTLYKYGNNPKEYNDAYINFLAKNPKGDREAAYALHNFTPDQIDEINKEYYSANPDKWQRTTGQTEPMNVEPRNPESASEQLASLQAKINWLHSDASPDRPVYHPNAGAVLEAKHNYKVADEKMREKFQMFKLGQMQNNALDRIQFRHDNAFKDEEGRQGGIDDAFYDENQEANQKAPITVKTATGDVTGRPISTYSSVAKELSIKVKGHDVAPNQTLKTPNGYIGLFNTEDDQGNPIVVQKQKSEKDVRPALYEEFFGKQKLGGAHPAAQSAAQPAAPKPHSVTNKSFGKGGLN